MRRLRTVICHGSCSRTSPRRFSGCELLTKRETEFMEVTRASHVVLCLPESLELTRKHSLQPLEHNHNAATHAITHTFLCYRVIFSVFTFHRQVHVHVTHFCLQRYGFSARENV